MPIAQAFIDELEQEAVATRRCLERVDQDQLGWRPHEKSLTLGQLAHHIAHLPAFVSQLLLKDGHALEDNPEERYPAPESAADLLATLDESLATAKEVLTALSDEECLVPWTLTGGGRELMTIPKAGLARMILLNHWYHHRGQLAVYLRMLDIPVPSVYGPTADESPWEEAMTRAR